MSCLSKGIEMEKQSVWKGSLSVAWGSGLRELIEGKVGTVQLICVYVLLVWISLCGWVLDEDTLYFLRSNTMISLLQVR